jgi:Ca2+-transporting ATPase
VRDALEQAHPAGLRGIMITGDFLPTAVAIAKKLDVIDDASQAIMGSDLDDMSDEEFAKRLPDLGVYARVRPEHKVRIVEAWEKRGYVVAMTGDGVNDAPSIKRANIGVGMGITGTDVTKNVADMVLADDNFATIVSAVREGRRIYDNIRKALQFLLSSNLAEVVAVFFATAMGFMLMKPAHLLWVNLITDSLPALALGMEKAEDNVMSRPPRDPKATIFADGLGLDTVVQGLMVAAITLLSYWIGCDFSFAQGQNAQGMTMAFLTLSIVEIVHSFNMRSLRGSVFKVHGHNKWLWLSAVAALAITFAVIEVPPLAALFSLVSLDPFHYLVALGLALFIFVLVEIYKAIVRAL